MSPKNKITGSSIETRVKHLITTEAFVAKNGENAEELHTRVLDIQKEFEVQQAGAIIMKPAGKITVKSLIVKPPPHRGAADFPTFSAAEHLPFPVIPPYGPKHVVIMDSTRAIFAYRFPIPEHLISTLEDSDKILPVRKPRAESSTSGTAQNRGNFTIREYAEWADYSKNTYMTNDFVMDMPHSESWRLKNNELFLYCSDMLRLIAPEQWIAMQHLRYTEGKEDKGQKGKRKASTLEDEGKKKHIGEAWAGVAINQNQTEDGETHWDVKDGRAKFNLAIPYGRWKGGPLVLWGIQRKVQVSRGEGLLFLGSAIAHEVVDIEEGVRNSLDMFSHQSNFLTRRKDKIHNNKFQKYATGATVTAGERKTGMTNNVVKKKGKKHVRK